MSTYDVIIAAVLISLAFHWLLIFHLWRRLNEIDEQIRLQIEELSSSRDPFDMEAYGG